MFAARPAPTRTFTDAPSPTLPLDGPVSKFPHVRSALGALVKQHKPLSELDVEDGSDSGRPSNALLHKVVAILDEEDGDALQTALAQTFGLGADEVSKLGDALVRDPPLRRCRRANRTR
jgi:hypothetical protein